MDERGRDDPHAPEPPPSTVDPRGAPRAGGGRDGFVLLLGFTVAMLALIVTLGWVVYHELVG